MAEKIAQGMAAAIKRLWPERKVFIGKVPQGLEDGCFVICCVGSRERALPGNRHVRRLTMEVCYFPAAGEDAMATLEQLYGCLELIGLPDGGRAAGGGMEAVVSGGVGVFSVTYGEMVYRAQEDGAEDGPRMTEMTCESAFV